VLAEYLQNIRALLQSDYARFRVMVERQVQVRVLPKLKGTRAGLETELWELLVLCLDGHQVSAPTLDDQTYERAQKATQSGTDLNGEQSAEFPRAAVAVLSALEQLRDVGVYPPPRR